MLLNNLLSSDNDRETVIDGLVNYVAGEICMENWRWGITAHEAQPHSQKMSLRS
jgi:hypothetical protein